MKTDTRITRLFSIVVTMTLLAVVTACNRAESTPATPAATATLFPTYQYIAPTEPPAIQTAAAATAAAQSTPQLDPDRVARGRDRYAALECGKCHGDQGEGTQDGSALAGTKLSEQQFIDMLRSGGKLGNDHLYSTNRLSDTGGRNIYLYVLSLSQKP